MRHKNKVRQREEMKKRGKILIYINIHLFVFSICLFYVAFYYSIHDT